jgi:penicillin-binding protein 1A
MSLMELTEIYQTLANQGTWVRPHYIIEVRNSNNEVLYHYEPLARQVFTPEVARQVTGMMENVLDFGTGAPVRSDFHFRAPAAAKTGTTNSYKDCWFEGETTHLVAGVWIGYDKPKMIMPGGYAARVALPVWARVMNRAKALYPMKPLPVPADLQEVYLTGPNGTREKCYLTGQQYAQMPVNTDTNTVNAPEQNRPGLIDKIINFFR